jgi:hypothetical protein
MSISEIKLRKRDPPKRKLLPLLETNLVTYMKTQGGEW